MPRSVVLLLTALGAIACGNGAGPDLPAPFTWPEATPAAQGMEAALLDSADARIRRDLPNVNALVVARRGHLVFERYYHGHGPAVTQEVHSVTKSFVAAFVGIALQRGWLSTVDQPIMPFFPEYFPGSEDVRKRSITVRHLLTMSSGIDFERTTRVPDDADWVGAIFAAPLAHDPGSDYLYDGGNPHLLSALITRLAGSPIQDAGRTFFFRRLGIEQGGWTRDPQGNNNGGTGMFLTARDMAVLGQLYLQDGVWEGERLLAEGWVARSMATAYDLQGTWDYGYLWWVAPEEVYGTTAWIAAGWRGQLIMVLPALEMVVAIQSESIAPRGAIVDHSFLVGRYLVPAARP